MAAKKKIRRAPDRPDRSRVATRQKQAPRIADLPELLTIPEYCAAYRVGRSSAYSMIRENKIPFVKHGRHVRILRTALQPTP